MIRRQPGSSRRSYGGNRYSYYTPQSFWGRNKPTIVMSGVVSLCCGTYYCQWTAERLAEKGNHALSDWIRQNFVNSADNIREGRWWVIVSNSFAHGNLVHLGINMYSLWGFGSAFVGIFGAPYFAGLWLVSAVSCSIAQNRWQYTQERLRREMVGRRWDKREDLPTLFSILGNRIVISREWALAISGGSGALGPHYGGSLGASGVLCGLIGTFCCVSPRMRVLPFFFLPFSVPLWLSVLLFTEASVFCMATGYVPQIGHAGHMGGMAAGIAYYYGAARPWLRRSGRL